ncbi:hypothetical protein PQQ51_15550 [Paraburkholderia xenovorans]|uniref:hypothetical protein n=1 Tax=Paraburkholderia xenovorans TaxID=36873 RepID=UPI0038B8DF7B
MNAPARLTYRLARDAQQPVTVAANAYRMPLASIADYARVVQCDDWLPAEPKNAAIATHETAPAGERRVLLDHVQYFAFLAELSGRVRNEIDASARLFFEVCAPYFGSLPPALLQPRVLLGVRLFDEAQWYGARGETVVWVGDHILRDLDYAGDNSIHCAVWPAHLASAVDAVLLSDWSRYAIRAYTDPSASFNAADVLLRSTRHE